MFGLKCGEEKMSVEKGALLFLQCVIILQWETQPWDLTSDWFHPRGSPFVVAPSALFPNYKSVHQLNKVGASCIVV